MEPTATSTFVAVGVSLAFQILKDRLNVPKEGIKLVAALLGAVAGGSASFVGGEDTVKALLGNTAIAGLIGPGLHGLLLKDSFLGRILKAIGDAVIKQPEAKP